MFSIYFPRWGDTMTGSLSPLKEGPSHDLSFYSFDSKSCCLASRLRVLIMPTPHKVVWGKRGGTSRAGAYLSDVEVDSS